MKISASKKQLAKIISENGGWPCDAEYSSQDGSDGQVSFYKCGTPIYNKLAKIWNAPGSCVHMYVSRIEGLGRVGVIKNFHQTILSRDEYFRLYPATDAELVAMLDDVTKENKHPEYCDSVMRSIPEPIDKPTIEQLAAEYRNLQGCADRKLREADAATEEADAALSRLIIACADFGFEIKPKGKLETSGASVIDKLQDKASELAESKLNITDWRDLQVGDEVEGRHYDRIVIGAVCEIDEECRDDRPFRIHEEGGHPWWVTSKEFKFIRRP